MSSETQSSRGRGGQGSARATLIGVLAAIATVLALPVGIMNPEIRCAVGLDACDTALMAVPIPIDDACRWAYPGKARGQWTGRGYGIVCLDAQGTSLGGFSDESGHSLNDWCADPDHTAGNPTLRQARVVPGDPSSWQCVPIA